MRIISLFSGAGGLDLGLIKAGNEVVWANDIDASAVETDRRNIGGHIVCKDIKDVSMGEIPDAADVVVGGFPCQGFSQANLLREVGDARNALYLFFRKVADRKISQTEFAALVIQTLTLPEVAVAFQVLPFYREKSRVFAA